LKNGDELICEVLLNLSSSPVLFYLWKEEGGKNFVSLKGRRTTGIKANIKEEVFWELNAYLAQLEGFTIRHILEREFSKGLKIFLDRIFRLGEHNAGLEEGKRIVLKLYKEIREEKNGYR
jgi:hypothetical protein